MKRKVIYNKTLIKHCDFVFAPQLQMVRLKIWQNKLSMYAKLFVNGREVMSASFYEKDGDMSIYRVKEYFNFFPEEEMKKSY